MKKRLLNACPAFLAFALFSLLLWWLGAYNFVYIEHLRTFYYDGTMIMRTLDVPGGVCTVVADFLIQWFYIPAAGVLVTAFLLTLLTCLVAALMRALGSDRALMPLTMLPGVALAFLNYNTNYLYSGNVALVVALAAVFATNRLDGSARFRLWRGTLVSVLMAVLVYLLCGPAASVYALLVVALSVHRGFKPMLLSLIPAVTVAVGGACSVDAGDANSLSSVLLPGGYFNPRLAAPQFVWMPWIMLAAVLSAGALSRYVKVPRRITAILSAAIVAVYAFAGADGSIDRDTQAFKELNCHIREGRWHQVEERCSSLSMDNLLMQNCLNLALAEQGRLAAEMFSHPCYDIRSIYITDESSPYMYMLLSDIYYSMGHIALAQRHAFEANESLRNLSPRMLQRLVDTNIEFGRYKVALKYISLLEKTWRYSDWARSRRALIETGDVDSDPEIALKRACIFPDNRFSAYNGLDDDLAQVVRANPGHRATVQYLGCLYLLSKDMPSFRSTMDEFYLTDALPAPLPDGFAQAMYLLAENDSVAARYGIPPEMQTRYESFKRDPEGHRNTLWFFLKYVR